MDRQFCLTGVGVIDGQLTNDHEKVNESNFSLGNDTSRKAELRGTRLVSTESRPVSCLLDRGRKEGRGKGIQGELIGENGMGSDSDSGNGTTSSEFLESPTQEMRLSFPMKAELDSAGSGPRRSLSANCGGNDTTVKEPHEASRSESSAKSTSSNRQFIKSYSYTADYQLTPECETVAPATTGDNAARIQPSVSNLKGTAADGISDPSRHDYTELDFTMIDRVTPVVTTTTKDVLPCSQVKPPTTRSLFSARRNLMTSFGLSDGCYDDGCRDVHDLEFQDNYGEVDLQESSCWNLAKDTAVNRPNSRHGNCKRCQRMNDADRHDDGCQGDKVVESSVYRHGSHRDIDVIHDNPHSDRHESQLSIPISEGHDGRQDVIFLSGNDVIPSTIAAEPSIQIQSQRFRIGGQGLGYEGHGIFHENRGCAYEGQGKRCERQVYGYEDQGENQRCSYEGGPVQRYDVDDVQYQSSERTYEGPVHRYSSQDIINMMVSVNGRRGDNNSPLKNPNHRTYRKKTLETSFVVFSNNDDNVFSSGVSSTTPNTPIKDASFHSCREFLTPQGPSRSINSARNLALNGPPVVPTSNGYHGGGGGALSGILPAISARQCVGRSRVYSAGNDPSWSRGQLTASEYRQKRSISSGIGRREEELDEEEEEERTGSGRRDILWSADPAMCQPFSEEEPVTLPRASKPRVSPSSPVGDVKAASSPAEEQINKRGRRRWTSTGLAAADDVSSSTAGDVGQSSRQSDGKLSRAGQFFRHPFRSRKRSDSENISLESVKPNSSASLSSETRDHTTAGNAAGDLKNSRSVSKDFRRSVSSPDQQQRTPSHRSSVASSSSFLERMRSRILGSWKSSPNKNPYVPNLVVLRDGGDLEGGSGPPVTGQGSIHFGRQYSEQLSPPTALPSPPSLSSAQFNDIGRYHSVQTLRSDDSDFARNSPSNSEIPDHLRKEKLLFSVRYLQSSVSLDQTKTDEERRIKKIKFEKRNRQNQISIDKNNNRERKSSMALPSESASTTASSSSSSSSSSAAAAATTVREPYPHGSNSLQLPKNARELSRKDEEEERCIVADGGNILEEILLGVASAAAATQTSSLPSSPNGGERTILAEEFNDHKNKMIGVLKKFIDDCRMWIIVTPTSKVAYNAHLSKCLRSLDDVTLRYRNLIDCTSLPADKAKVAKKLGSVGLSFKEAIGAASKVAGLSVKHPEMEQLKRRAIQLVEDLISLMKIIKDMNYNHISRRF